MSGCSGIVIFGLGRTKAGRGYLALVLEGSKLITIVGYGLDKVGLVKDGRI